MMIITQFIFVFNYYISICRAKTNKASLPGFCLVPKIIDVGVDFVSLEVTFTSVGGSPIINIIIETMNLDDSTIKIDKVNFNIVYLYYMLNTIGLHKLFR